MPEDANFATKPALARRLVERVLAAGAHPAWVVADAVYGADYQLRVALEAAGQPYVLAVTGQQCVTMGFGQKRVKTLKAEVPAAAWAEIRVAAGTKGPRVFDWAALRINHPHGKAGQRFVLLRRSRSEAQEITAYLVFGAADTSLQEMATVAARRWAIEESFAQSKSEVGLDQYEVRQLGGLAATHDPGHDRTGAAGDHPRPTLRQTGGEPGCLDSVQKKPRAATGSRRRLIRVSVAEVRRFFVALLWGAGVLLTHVLHWSNWRRHHQALAMFFHYKTRNALAYLQL